MGRPAASEREAYDANALVDVALRVFRRRGYDGASMADIAEAAGIRKSSLYHHVSGKEELLARGLHRALDSLGAAVADAESGAGPAVDRLRTLVRRTVEIMIDDLAEVTVLLRVRGNTETERWALERRREIDERVERLVTAAIAEGGLRDDVEPGLATRLVFGMSNSVTEWLRPEGPLDAGAVADAVVAIAFEGLGRARPAG